MAAATKRGSFRGIALFACLFMLLIASTTTLTAAPVSSTTHAAWKLTATDTPPAPGADESQAFSISAPRGEQTQSNEGEPQPATDFVVGCATTLHTADGTSGNERAPNLRNRFGRSVYLILASELAAAGIGPGTQFAQIGWSFATAPGLSGSNNLIVYMENTGDTTNTKSATWATAIATMTIVHNAATTIPNVTGGWDINLSAGGAFTYTGGGLYVAFDAAYPVGTLSTATVVNCNQSGVPGGLLGAQGAAAPTTLAASSFRPVTRLTPLVATILNDAAVDNVQAYGSLPRDLTSAEVIKAQVSNRGANALTNVPVTLTVTGANPFTDTKIVPSLAACTGTAIVTFAAHPHPNAGSDTITVSVPSDDLNSNNSKAVPQNVTINKYDYKHPGTVMQGGVGLTGATGELAGKFRTTGATAITDVTLEFFAASATAYRVAIYADAAGLPGALLYLDAADRTVGAAGPVTITLPGPVAVGPGNFYVGVRQNNTTNMNLSFDNEVAIRTQSFFGSIPIGSAWFDFNPGNNFKINVGVLLNPCFAASACDDSNLCTADSCTQAGGCAHVTTNCDDGQICTVDSCNPATGQCEYSPLPCDDGNACTDDDCIQALALTPPCTAPDNGSGTATIPPTGCSGYLSPNDVHEIINGLPPGTTIQFAAQHTDFICGSGAGTPPPAACSFIPSPACETQGGSLGGEKECRDSSLVMQLSGTGTLAGWNRTVVLPISFEAHTAPRTPGAPVQSFAAEMERAMGQLPPGDPDFDLLRVTAGNSFGLPSPGHTTLRSIGGGQWAVDSFFDITYRIDFIGAPGGHIGGMSGSTTATIRMQMGSGVGCVHSPTDCNDNNPCTIDSCDSVSGCIHAPVSCDDGQICTTDSCNPATGQCEHTPTNCDDGNLCTTDSCVQALLTPPCTVPDNGGGTVTLPPAGCEYLSPTDVHEIIDGLPAGTTIELGAIHRDFICNRTPGATGVCSFQQLVDCDEAGGSLGGEKECSDSTLALTLHGTGTLGGFNRSIQLPISFETHTAPRTPGAPVQSFDTDMFRLFGQITGDPDFDLLRIVAGTDFGLPSPGHTTLTQQGTNWAVDSFFDITYRIDFVGAPGGNLAGRSGSTTGTIRMQVGSGVGCVHDPVNCDDGQICTVDSCDPLTGECVHTPANCDDGDPCTVDGCVQALLTPPCTVPDNGGGTVTLPPAGCDYLSPQDVHEILNGLPAGTTVELGAIHRDFICHSQPGASVCSFPPPGPNDCDQAGGTLGGDQECADSNLSLTLHGTGTLAGWDRPVSIPISFETHTGPRTPGAPVQSFDTDMFRLFGQITGDPDFDLLRIVAGTDFGLPSPGHTTLTQQGGGNWAVDSFFDITYRIDFVGAPGGHLAGRSGSTTGTIRMQVGSGVGCTHTPVVCDDGNACTDDSCNPNTGQCEYAPHNCNDNNACTDDGCNADSGCFYQPTNCDDGQICTVDACDPVKGCVHSPLDCNDNNPCTSDTCIQALDSLTPPCTVTGAGGTVTLPPAGCDYLSPQDVHEILNGLPAGTTIEFGAIHREFICRRGDPASICSFNTNVDCQDPGGDLGGDMECSDSTLQLNLNGTGTLGGWARTLTMPIKFETHTGPRTPGNPVQSFPTEMFRLMGQLPPGDPDFDLLRITAGNDFGLPSPGHTTLRHQGGNQWAVDSFFDITYRIDFVGRPGGHIGGMSGSTTGTIRMQVGAGVGCVNTPIPAPGVVDNGLRVNKTGTVSNISWNMALNATSSDVLRGSTSAFPVGPGGGDEACVGNDVAGTTANDAAVPGVGGGLWYLVRGVNVCTSGPYGNQGVNGAPGAPRTSTTCP